MLKLIPDNARVDWMRGRRIGYAVSIITMLIGLAAMVMHHGIRLGVDFAGGRLVEYRFSQPVSTEILRQVIGELGLPGEIQRIGESDTDFMLRIPVSETEATSSASPTRRILEEIQGRVPGVTGEVRREELVGPKVGKELRGQALAAVLATLIGILIYVAVRYEFRFALGGVIALAHDVVVAFLMSQLAGFELTIPVIAALMTIGGFSINDTVVVYDRIREEMKLRQGQPLGEVMNLAINRTLSRTVLTSLTVFFSTAALLVFGGTVIRDFAFTMLVGVVFGVYSSVFIASALALELQLAHDRRQAGAKPAVAQAS